MIRRAPSTTLAALYAEPASNQRQKRIPRPVWEAPLHRPSTPLSIAPVTMGMGRPAQNAAGQP